MNRFLGICALILMAPVVHADGTYNGKTVDCYCTDSQGARVELGQTICLQVDGRMFMALCDMSLNVPTWRDVGEGCMSSSLSGQQSQPFADTGGVHPMISIPKT